MFKRVCNLFESVMKSEKLKQQRKIASNAIKMSNTPHPSRDPPSNYKPKILGHKAFTIPDYISPTIFRPFESCDEILGPDADKCKQYKNPEYFSYHRYSFAELLINVGKLREKQLKDGAIRIIYECDSDSDGGSSWSSSEKECSDDEPCPPR